MRPIEFAVDAELTIRAVGAGDAQVVLQLYRRCEDFLALGPAAKASHGMVLSDLRYSERDGGQYCGIYAGGRLVGVVDWVTAENRSGPAFINLLMIGSGDRGRGIGRRVLGFLEAQAAAIPGSEAVETACQVNNEPGLRFWRRQGYEAISGPIRNDDGTTVLRLRKAISGGTPARLTGAGPNHGE